MPNNNVTMTCLVQWRSECVNVLCVIAQWHSLSREEQAKYYEKARQERQLHMQLYPGWSARDNYGYGTKKKKRKKERTPIESGGSYLCRSRTLTSRVPDHHCRHSGYRKIIIRPIAHTILVSLQLLRFDLVSKSKLLPTKSFLLFSSING